MTTRSRTALAISGSAVIIIVALLYLLFHGYFDHGKFEIKQVQWASSKQVAMVAERSDDQALGGLEYFVLVGDHVFTPNELRHAYYGDGVIFSALADCLDLRWDGSSKLTIACTGSVVDTDHINAQKQRSGKLEIFYKNIAVK